MGTWRDAGIGLAIAMAAAAVYWPVGEYGFVNFDDSSYIYQNPNVRGGLSWEGAAWAFAGAGESNWHPLTWLSHMLDCQLFGLDAGRHHAVGVLLHVIDAVLLFAVLLRMTAARWPSAIVAGLFALHPLHVESVAWVSERKDVLSTLFWILTMWAHVRYAERPSISRYVPVFLFLALGLAAKPMLVTLPLVLLLLDYWPLGRFRRAGIKFLAAEKIPLFVLSAASCAVTWWAQQAGGAMEFGRAVPPADRISNAVVSYAAYLGKTVWPADLSAFYPYITGRPLWQPLAAAALLAAVTALAVWQLRRRPYLAVGWFWYLGTLAPVIGIVQVGKQGMADRYTYVPLIGIFIAAAWLAADLTARWRDWGKVLAPAVVGVLVACGIAARQQVQYWENGETLFGHAIEAAPDNSLAHCNLGVYLASVGRHSEALAHFREAACLDPCEATLHSNIGMMLGLLGGTDEQIAEYREAIRLKPEFGVVHANLVVALAKQGRSAAAVACVPDALRYAPDDPELLTSLAGVLCGLGRLEEGAEFCRKALRIDPDMPGAHTNWGNILLAQGNAAEAIVHFREAVRLRPAAALGHSNLAAALLRKGAVAEAIAEQQEALRLVPDLVDGLQRLARLRATWPDARFRNGDEAVSLAERACAITARRDPACLDALAAAYAEAGRLAEAAAAAREAVALAREQGRSDVADDIGARLKCYESGKPWRSAPPGP